MLSPYEYALLSKASYFKPSSLFRLLPTIHCTYPANGLADDILYLYLKDGVLKVKGKRAEANLTGQFDTVKVALLGEKFNPIRQKLAQHEAMQALTTEEASLIMHEALINGYAQASIYLLETNGWEFLECVNDAHGYRGSLWVHHDKRHIVIAHRGSKNLDSWVTDAESIRGLKPGCFVEQAIGLLKHPQVQAFKKENYQLSVTGHSLGGFLAQVTAYWAQRSEFKETYYPNISATVFDSPGAVDFLAVLNSNLYREKDRILIEHLNIQNFCAMPTVVSTYGVHTGTVWHLSSDLSQIRFDIVNAHRMEPILAGFNPKTGYPFVFRQMRDWPEANYSNYDSVSTVIQHALNSAARLPFDCLNQFYKTLGRPFGYSRKVTWYEQIFSDKEGEFGAYCRATTENRFPSLEDVEQILTLAIHGHYSPLHEETSMKRLDIHHFDQDTQTFLVELFSYKPWNDDLFAALQTHYSEGLALLLDFQLIQEGNITEVQIENYSGTVLAFKGSLQLLIENKGIFSVRQFLAEKEQTLSQSIAGLEIALPRMRKELAATMQAEIVILKEELNTLITQKKTVEEVKGRIFNLRTATAEVSGTLAVRELKPVDYAPERHAEMLSLMNGAKPGDEMYVDSARATASNTAAIVSSGGVSDSTAQLMLQFAERYQSASKVPQEKQSPEYAEDAFSKK